MAAIEVKPGIFWVGVNDRTTDLFEGLWPITNEGVSYNSYLILDEKKVLVDLAKDHQVSAFLEQIRGLVDPAELDYIVINHMEPDHTGLGRVIEREAPNATFLCTEKAKGMLEAFYHITDNVRVVSDGEELAIGEKTLQFFSVPFVHWPETMVTFEQTQQVLFSCDAFGGYGALAGSLFDDQCTYLDHYIQEALRYYANIVALFSRPVLRAIDKLQGLDIDVVAPSHGLVWRQEPERIIQLYQQWAKYTSTGGESGITLLYGSMYGNTERAMNAVAEGISRTGLPLKIFDASRIDAAYVLSHLWSRRGIVVGAPTYESAMFPPVKQTLDIATEKRITNKKVAYFGSYGWSGGARRDLEQLAESLDWNVVDTLEFRGAPSTDDLDAAQALGERFARNVAEV
ncbi:MAG: FprA family A-type flavoprotein [Anaerolineae bacterium]